MMQVAVQRIGIRAVIARSVIIDRISRAGKASVSAISGSVALTVGRLTWLWIASGLIKRAFFALVWFWNIPVLGAEETLESRYLRNGRFN